MEQTYETGFKRFIIVITVIFCALLEIIDTSIVNVAIPELMGNLGATLSEVSWVVAAYSIANVIIVPMTGWLSRQFGRTNYFTFSIILFTIASVACGNSHGIWELVFFRFVQGIGGGALLSTSQSILMETFPPSQAGLASALFGMGVIIGPTIGPTLGGYIVDNYNWRWIFYVNVPIGTTAALMTMIYIKDKLARQKTSVWDVDWLGIFLLIVGVGALQLVLEKGQEEDWFAKPYIVASTAIAIIGIISFIWRELVAEHPIVNLRVLRNPNLALGTVLTFVLGFALFGSVFAFPVLMESVLGFTAQQTGEMFIPGALCSGLMMPVVGILLQRGVPQKFLVSFGFIMFFIFTLMVRAHITSVSSDDDFFWALIVRGLGMGFLFVPITTLALASLKGKEIAEGAGLTNMMRQLGGSIGVAIVSSFVSYDNFKHRTDLLSHMTPYDPAYVDRFNGLVAGFMAKSHSLMEATQRAYQILEFTLYKQTTILTYMDVFLYMGIFCTCCIPFVLMTNSKKQQGKVDMSAAH